MVKCPECGADLRFTEEGTFVCDACGKVYGPSSRAEQQPRKEEQKTDAVASDNQSALSDIEQAATEQLEEKSEMPVAEEAKTVPVEENVSAEEESLRETAENSDNASEPEIIEMSEEKTAEDGPSTAEETSVYKEKEKQPKGRKTFIEAIKESDLYGKIMWFVPAGLTFLFAILMLGFIGADAIREPSMFGTVSLTGYDMIAEEYLLVSAYYGLHDAFGFAIAMVVILLCIGIAQGVLAGFNLNNRIVKYSMYVAEMCIFAMLFVTSCYIVDHTSFDTEMTGLVGGPCGALMLSFTMVWMAGTPIAYLFSVNSSVAAAKDYLLTYVVVHKNKAVETVKKMQAKNKARAEAKAAAIAQAQPPASETVAQMTANSAAIVPTAVILSDDDNGDIIEAKPAAPVATACEAGDDEILTSFAEVTPATTPVIQTTTVAYSPKYGLTLDDVIESAYLKGGNYVSRIGAGLSLFLLGLVAIVYSILVFRSSGSWISMVYVVALGIVILIVSCLSKTRISRTAFSVLYVLTLLLAIFSIYGPLIISSTLAQTYPGEFEIISPTDIVETVFFLCAGYVLLLSLAAFFTGIQRRKNDPLAERKYRSRDLATGIVVIVLSAILLVIPGIIYGVDPFINESKLELGMSQSEVQRIMGEPDYYDDDMYIYADRDSAKYYQELSELENKYDTTDADDERLMQLYFQLESMQHEYLMVEFSNGKVTFISHIANSLNENRYAYSNGYEFVKNPSGVNDTTLYVQVESKYDDGSWDKGYKSVSITDMDYYSSSDTMTICFEYYIDGQIHTSSAESKTVSQWNEFFDVMTYYNTNFASDTGGSDTGSDTAQTVFVTSRSILEQYFILQNDSNYPFASNSNPFTLTSTNKSDNSTSTFTLTAKSSFTFTFEYEVSSERNYDKFQLKIGNNIEFEKSGEESDSYSVDVQSGDVIKFVYSKNGSVNNGNDGVIITPKTIVI